VGGLRPARGAGGGDGHNAGVSETRLARRRAGGALPQSLLRPSERRLSGDYTISSDSIVCNAARQRTVILRLRSAPDITSAPKRSGFSLIYS
jgi:hypothetical protein